jgi:hypothetical protein
MTTQDVYNELLEDGFTREWLQKCIELGVTLPRSKRYQVEQPEEPDF